KRSIRQQRQIACESTLRDENDRDGLFAGAVGCRKLNGSPEDNQEVELGLALTQDQLTCGYFLFFGERPDRINLLICEQGKGFFQAKAIERAIGIPQKHNIR